MKLQAKRSVFMSRGRPLKAGVRWDKVKGWVRKVAEVQPDGAHASIYKARIARRAKRMRRENREFNRLAVSTHDAGS